MARTDSESHGRRILVADDDIDVLETVKAVLKRENYRVDTARSPIAVVTELAQESFDAVLIELNFTKDTTSGQEGLALLNEIRNLDPDLPIIVMTAWATVSVAIEAMRRGAKDFVEKPFEPVRLRTSVATQVELSAAIRKTRLLETELTQLRSASGSAFIAESSSMERITRLVAKVGPSDASVLITGEPGTGKEVIARMIHGVSRRASRPLVTVNVGGLPDTLFESELFGHVKGAFTDARTDRIGRFELANGGTLFLDEIGNVPLHLQSKLLRVLESGEMERVGSSKTIRIDVRLITATNADLAAAVAANRFRDDLFYRLNTVEIPLPPLRERREDIPLLAAHFLALHGGKYAKHIDGFDEEAMLAMQTYNWRGNIREMNHVIERAVILADSKIHRADLGLSVRAAGNSFEDMTLEQLEEAFIRKALSRYAGNATTAAQALGLSRSALYRRMQQYGI
jgi:DNA-binding NtrC family response regulator